MALQFTFKALVELNIECRIGIWQGKLRTPVIRLLEKALLTSIARSHMKVPVVLSNDASEEWFSSKVIMEL